MCGIFGMIFAKSLRQDQLYKAREFFTEMALSAMSRGHDAAGFAALSTNQVVTLHRAPKSALEQISSGIWHRAMHSVDRRTRVLIGHTRAATHGANVTMNAHPHSFTTEHGTLLGTHNGIIYNYEDLYPGPGRPYENDSANLFSYLSQFPDETFAEAFNRVSGWFALAMYREGKVYLVRHSAPMVVADALPFDALVYASSDYIIKEAARATDVETTEAGVVQENTLYSLSPSAKLLYKADITPSTETYSAYNRAGAWEMYSEYRKIRGWDEEDTWSPNNPVWN